MEKAGLGGPRPPPPVPLADFLEYMLGEFRDRGIPHCILRNYDALPERNVGNDIDILVDGRGLAAAISVLRNCPDTVVTGVVRRAGGVNLFVSGVEWDGGHALQVDLLYSIAWKGLPIVDAEGILARSRRAPGRPDIIRVPSAVDEACVSFLTSYVVGGFVKEKYQARVREVFSSQREAVVPLLSAVVGAGLADSLASAVSADDRARLSGLLPALRRAILVRAFFRAPLSSAARVLVHYAREAYIRYTTAYRVSVCLLGPDGAGKTVVAEALRQRMVHCAKSITIRHLKPDIFFRGRRRAVGPVVDPHGKPPRSVPTSLLKIALWAIELWIDRLFASRTNLTIEIWDRYYHDLLVDPLRYRYGGPPWIARAVARLIPVPDQFVILDAPPEVLRQRKQEVTPEETARQRDAYLALARSLPNAGVVDAAQAPDLVARDAAALIVARMAIRAARRAGSGS